MPAEHREGAGSNKTVQPNSAHVSEDLLLPFLQGSFDAADYLNDALTSSAAASASLSELSAQTQTLISQLNAHSSRLSNTLTQLTDDILRGGGRLAYEVEVLRGETLGLSDALTEDLQDDIVKFVPQGLRLEISTNDESKKATGSDFTEIQVQDSSELASGGDGQPQYLSQLRMLTKVRERLESVIKVFGDAMQWTLPQEVSLASSLISVSAPATGPESHSREIKAREFAARLQTEISDLVTGDIGTGIGFESAMLRIQALKELAQVWKGTAEEKPRVRFIEGLVKLAEERHNALHRDTQQQKPARDGALAVGNGHEVRVGGDGGYGFLGNLQRMRDGLYLE